MIRNKRISKAREAKHMNRITIKLRKIQDLIQIQRQKYQPMKRRNPKPKLNYI